MTLISWAMALFPTFLLLLSGGTILWFGINPSWLQPCVLFGILYVFPLLVFRVHQLFFPIQLGVTRLSGKEYSSWWGGHQIQLLYYAFPALEALLKMIPGGYSFWLRLWGSRIGKQVYWTPNTEIGDRSMVEIGSRVVFGHKVQMYSHIVTPHKSEFGAVVLIAKPIKIGSNCFIGAGSVLGPGSDVPDGTMLPLQTYLTINNKPLTTAPTPVTTKPQ